MIYDAEHFFDGYKDDPDHALATLAAARDGGADLLVLCDTNGGCLPDEVDAIFRAAAAHLSGAPAGHPHAQRLRPRRGQRARGRARRGGAGAGDDQRLRRTHRQLQPDDVIPCLQAKMGLPVVADLPQLTELSFFVDELANCPHDPRAPFIGSTAFAHKGGVHVHAVQKLARSYEHMDPAAVGNRQHILVSELSGQSNVLAKAQALGLAPGQRQPGGGRRAGRDQAAGKGRLRVRGGGGELRTARAQATRAAPAAFHLAGIPLQLPPHRQPRSTRPARRRSSCASATANEYTVAEGDGPVNALDAAVRKALRPFYPAIDGIALQDYKVRIIDSHQATAARTRVLIVSSDGHEAWSTVGVSGNIIEASWLALVDSLEYRLRR